MVKMILNVGNAHQVENIQRRPFFDEFNQNLKSAETTRFIDGPRRPDSGIFEAVLKIKFKKL
jgi:hypothetical protein